MLDKREIRLHILEALDAAMVPMFRDKAKRDSFLAEDGDYSIAELNMDSLGLMEFCISLEINDVYFINPEELVSFESLNQLVMVINESQK